MLGTAGGWSPWKTMPNRKDPAGHEPLKNLRQLWKIITQELCVLSGTGSSTL